MGRYERRQKEAINETFAKQLYMLTVEYIQRVEFQKANKKEVFFQLDGQWKRIVTAAKNKKPPVELNPDALKNSIANTKSMNNIRKGVFGKKPTFFQKLKALVQ